MRFDKVKGEGFFGHGVGVGAEGLVGCVSRMLGMERGVRGECGFEGPLPGGEVCGVRDGRVWGVEDYHGGDSSEG